MNPFDYALGLLTILMGLALADVCFSFHKLAVRARTIRWDGRPLVAAALVIVECVRLWFGQWTLRNFSVALTFPIYFSLFIQMLVLVLLASACLPDEPADDCNLGVFYEQRRRYFWGLFALYHAMYFALWLVFSATNASGTAPAGIVDWIRVLAPVLAFSLLALVRSRWLDYLVPV
ncbi:MAG TPA: hypothetical protein VE221_00325, partial [Sphingomicrobium sp.]|nr:hypothetical protein [Sphingomicrobium sp.]